MKYGLMLIAGLACVLLMDQVAAGCLCGATGEDYCSSCKGVVRPIPKLLNRLVENKFAPIGDKCGCGKQVVEPAIPPKPICPKKTCTCKNTCNCDQPSYPVVLPCEAAKPKVVPGPPADPVSVSLAYNAGKARSFAVPEAKLSFGFNRRPINGEKQVYYSNVPEEKLYSLHGEVIKLERRQPKQKPEIIELSEEEEDSIADDAPPYLTYGELGYSLEKFKNPKFLNVANVPIPVDTYKEIPIGNCGYKPGKVVPYKPFNEGYLYGNDGCYMDV